MNNKKQVNILRRRLGQGLWAAPVAAAVVIPQHATATPTATPTEVAPQMCSDADTIRTLMVSAGDSGSITVPMGTRTLTFTIIGASGANGATEGSSGMPQGGAGWQLSGEINVQPGQQIDIVAGAMGTEGILVPNITGDNPPGDFAIQPVGGFGGAGFGQGGNGGNAVNGGPSVNNNSNQGTGGSGGGGASALLINGQAVLVAGGGGGSSGGQTGQNIANNDGGNALAPDQTAQSSGAIVANANSGSNASGGDGGNGGNTTANVTTGTNGGAGGGGGGGITGGGGGSGDIFGPGGNTRGRRGGNGGLSLIAAPNADIVSIASTQANAGQQGSVEIMLICE